MTGHVERALAGLAASPTRRAREAAPLNAGRSPERRSSTAPAGRLAGDVVIEGDRIAAIGHGERRGTVIDAAGLVAAPGFVDIHSHVDWIAPLADGPGLLEANVRQGITTSVAGNCGISPAPLGGSNRGASRADAARRARSPTGSAGTGAPCASTSTRSSGEGCRSTSRSSSATARSGRPSSAASSARRRRASRPRCARCSPRGCATAPSGCRSGSSTSRAGTPARPRSRTSPRSPPRTTRLVAVHTRGISALFDPAMEEAIEFAHASGCRLQIAHVNPMGRANWDAIDELFASVDARARGGPRRGLRHHRLHRVDDDRDRGAPTRRLRSRRRRRSRARRARRRPRAPAAARRARKAGLAPLGRGPGDAQRPARDGLGRALPRGRTARLRRRPRADPRRPRGGLRRGAVRRLLRPPPRLGRRRADRHRRLRRRRGRRRAAAPARAAAGRDSRDRHGAGGGERQGGRCRCRCSGGRCPASSPVSRATSSCCRSRTRSPGSPASRRGAPGSRTAASSGRAPTRTSSSSTSPARRPGDVHRAGGAGRHRVGLRERRADRVRGRYDPASRPGRALRARTP